ncbi:MAG: cation:proton antiporter [Cyanobacteria bacterium P01_H01_bin.119]
MTTVTILWITLPFFIGFSVYLLPQLGRYLALAVALGTAVYGFGYGFIWPELSLQLLDRFGVLLQIDTLSGFFVLTNGLVTAAVLLYCWNKGYSAFFYTQIVVLHGSVNATFICADFISLYVALEVISIAAFLLIAYSRTNRSIWVGLRYLFVSNTAMLFYLIGAMLVYQANQSFAFAGLAQAPPEAIALIFLGLLTKGGIFVSGLWLPLTHSEAATPISALLSGVVIKVGVFPLVRCALMVEAVDPIVRGFGVATALLGVSYAVFEKDTKRMLAFSTVSQLGFVLASPVAAGFYALTHGLVKAALFLGAGNLPSRSFKMLRQSSQESGTGDSQPTAIAPSVWLAMAIAGFSISGLPLLAGFGAKAWTMETLLPWQGGLMNVAVVGTAIVVAKFIFLPHGGWGAKPAVKEAGGVAVYSPSSGFWPAMAILLGGLVVANAVYPSGYTVENLVKACVKVGIGWLLYWGIVKRSPLHLPQFFEQFDQLIGVMSLMLVALFWMVMA